MTPFSGSKSEPNQPPLKLRRSAGAPEQQWRAKAEGSHYGQGKGLHHGSLSRRDLLKALPVVAALTACRRALPYRPSDFSRPARSTVAILDAPNYSVDFADVITRGLRELAFDVRGRSVLLKPNMIEYEPGRLINTNPLVASGAATAFLNAGAREVVIAEGPGHRRDMEYLLTATGFSDQIKDLRVRFVDLNHDDVTQVALKSHFTGVDQMLLPVELMKADVIVSLPKLKTHHWAAMTASMKNFFGVVPGAVYGWPKNFLHFHGIDNSIVDLVATIRPHFTIVDAVIAMEGDGPIMGRPRQTGFLAMGPDLVAVDATCARLIGFDPAKIQYLAWAGDFLGYIDEKHIEQRGESVARYRTRFDVLPDFKEIQVAGGA